MVPTACWTDLRNDEARGGRVLDQDRPQPHPALPGRPTTYGASRACPPFPKLSASLEQGRPHSIGLSSRTLRCLTGRLAVRRGEIRTRWRRFTADRQALLALAHLRRGDTCARPAAGFGIGIATTYRCIREAVEALTEAGLKCWADKAYQGADGLDRTVRTARERAREQQQKEAGGAEVVRDA